MTRKEIFNESDLLQGGINRMFVTDDPEELEQMHEASKKGIEKIYQYNYERLHSGEGKEND